MLVQRCLCSGTTTYGLEDWLVMRSHDEYAISVRQVTGDISSPPGMAPTYVYKIKQLPVFYDSEKKWNSLNLLELLNAIGVINCVSRS